MKTGDTVAVVGDGAVGLCAVLAAKRLGAERIIALSRHPDRQELAREFGATDIVEERGEEAIQAVLDLTGGIGADAALECVGTAQSIATAFADRPARLDRRHRRRPARRELPFAETFFRNIGWRGGAGPGPRSTSPNCSATCSTASSTPAGSSTTKPISTTSPTPTGHGRAAGHQVAGAGGSAVMGGTNPGRVSR